MDKQLTELIKKTRSGFIKDEELDAFAEECGLEIVEPLPNELQVDIDSPEMPLDFDKKMHILGQMYTVLGHKQTRSKNGNIHVHVLLIEKIGPVERIMLQALLGSDPVRELLTLKNFKEGKRRLQFLFEVKK